MMKKIAYQFYLFSFFLFLGACTTTEKMPVPVDDRSVTTRLPEVEIATEKETTRYEAAEEITTADDRQGTIEAAPIESSSRDTDTVVLAFLNEAEEQAANGNTDQAIVSLERGVRIKPKSPWLWHQLAVLRLQKHQWQEAIALAEKSIALSGSNNSLLAGNWQIIAAAKRAIGDDVGAEAAEKKVKQYQPFLTSQGNQGQELFYIFSSAATFFQLYEFIQNSTVCSTTKENIPLTFYPANDTWALRRFTL